MLKLDVRFRPIADIRVGQVKPVGVQWPEIGTNLYERVRAAVLTGFREVARFVKLDPVEQLRRSGIPAGLLSDPDNWLPAAPVAEMLERCSDESGRSDFAVLMAECRTFSSLGPISLLLANEANLERVIHRLSEFRKHLNDVFEVQLEETGEVTILHWTVTPEFLRPQTTLLVSAMGYRALIDAMHGHWQPATAHFQISRPRETATFQRFFSCELEFNSSFSGLSFPTANLRRANPRGDEALAAHAARLLQLIPVPRPELLDQTQHALLLLLPNGTPALSAVADALGTSTRSLQRGLAAEGVTYAQLLNDARRQLATNYLASPARTISDVAGLLGYSSLSAFSRWFADEFGMSPMSWRRALNAI